MTVRGKEQERQNNNAERRRAETRLKSPMWGRKPRRNPNSRKGQDKRVESEQGRDVHNKTQQGQARTRAMEWKQR